MSDYEVIVNNNIVEVLTIERGLTGPRGLTGEKGSKGDKGEQGNIGMQGVPGDIGPKGDKGIQGDIGERGYQGQTGMRGLQGFTGPRGYTGDKGEQGIQGPIGETGLQGIKGDTGLQGIQGIKGDQGVKGEVGPKGDKGDKGDVGIQGPKGDVGSDATVTIANTLTEVVPGKALDATQGKALDDKIGVLSNLTTTSKIVVGAINEVDADLTTHKADYTEDKKPFYYNHVMQEYVNVDKYWEGLKNGKIYTSEFNRYNVSPVSTGIKKDDNLNLVCEPSTNTVRGRNDYEKIGLFMSLDVNGYVDANDNYHIKAIKGDGRFAKDGTMGDVYVIAMAGYQKRYETATTWGVSYSDTMHAGFEILDEAVKPDGTIRPYLLHAKYVAGRNPHENNNLASISGVYAEFVNMSYNGQLTEFAKKGIQYSGKTSHDDYYVQLMMWLKYPTTNSDTIMKGCQSYYLQYVNLVAETGVNRVIITNAQANALVVGSTVSIGDYEGSTKTDDRQQTINYNKANRVNITSIVDLGNGNSAIYVNSSNFDTTLTTTITTYPWNSGGCDNVLGQDGSPYSNTSGKEPFIISGIEMVVGGYEVLQNLIIRNNNVDNRIDVYANYDCKTYTTSPNTNYDLVGQLAQTNNAWKYGSKMAVSQNHPSIILVTEVEASSTTGTGDGIYTNAPSAGGYRVWLSLGGLSNGALCGLRYLAASNALSASSWYVLGRLSATGRSRRRAGVN